RQNIPFRGHRDHGNFFENDLEKNSIVNKGNFRELLHCRINSGDSILEKHLKTTHSKATYISPIVQNELIDCCSTIVTEIILKEIKETKFYSVIFDETTDISHSSQMSIVIRYVHKAVVKENFIAFIDCHAYLYNTGTQKNLEPKLNGEVLGDAVISLLQKFDLDLKYCVGIGTDGCSVMVSLVRGAVQKIQSYAKNAIHCPCANHALNLSISKSSSVQSIRNSVGLMKEIIEFFNCSSKRNFILKTVLGGQPRLQSLCETRWIERHDSVMIFKKSIPYTIDALTKISEWDELVSSSKAKSLLTAMCSCEFIIAIQCLSNILCVTVPMSQNKRNNCQSIFEEIFKECEELMIELDIDVKVPRLSKKQTNRANNPTKTTEEYYRVSVCIPLLDSIIEDLKSRFLSKENKLLLNLCLLVPRYIVDITGEDFKKIIEAATKLYNFNETVLDDKLELQTELELWKTK
ncbi:52 kDa repressor of the inhibitor of the protein kinase-like, partial [Aphis craccivora]